MRVWPFLVAAPLALGAVADAAPRTKGKVVRVERSRSASSVPRICEVRNAIDGVCFGPQPLVGDIVTVLSEERVIAEVRVTDVSEYATGRSVACPGLYSIKVELIRGDFDSNDSTVGIVDRDLDPRSARKTPRAQHPDSPSNRPGEVVQIAIDREGDGVADILVAQSDCDGTGQLCFDEWARVDRKMVRVFQTNFSNCSI